MRRDIVLQVGLRVRDAVIRLWTGLERVIGMLWLACWYFAALWMVLATLSSFHFQQAISPALSITEVLEAVSDLQAKTELNSKERSPNNIAIMDTLDKKIAEIKTKFEQKGSGDFADKLGDFVYLQSWGFTALILMPNYMLTPLLAVSMGALGSVLYMTRSFLASKGPKGLSWYKLRPLLGGALALGIFILLKGGQMILGGHSRGASIPEDLDPFFISFLALGSGMLSEHAYARISSAGARLIKAPEEEISRWARASVIAAALDSQGKMSEELVQYVRESVNKIDAWLGEAEPVPERVQVIIAAWLGAAPRDLFTDQSPDGVVVEDRQA
jgi:hypothetical protein